MNHASRFSKAAPRVLALVLLATAGFGGIAMAYEEPRYEVLRSAEDYEIRAYAPFIVAEVDVSGSFDEAGSRAFRILAGYIFGKNQRSVLTLGKSEKQAESVKMAMTVPVLSTETAQGATDSYTYSFVMPSEFSLETLPTPLDSRVQIRVVPERLVAVRRYSGRSSEKRYLENEAQLLEALGRDGVDTEGTAQFARYNAPWTPWFLRRNEIMIGVTAAD